MDSKSGLKWYATRIIRERSYVLKLYECLGLETLKIADIPSFVFIRTDRCNIERLRYEIYDYALFYKNASRSEVESIPDRTIENFRILAPMHDKPVIYLPVDNKSFFDGPRFVVISGIFKGFEGTIKRIKGTKRLVVRVSDHAAFATPYIPADMLKPLDVENP